MFSIALMTALSTGEATPNWFFSRPLVSINYFSFRSNTYLGSGYPGYGAGFGGPFFGGVGYSSGFYAGGPFFGGIGYSSGFYGSGPGSFSAPYYGGGPTYAGPDYPPPYFGNGLYSAGPGYILVPYYISAPYSGSSNSSPTPASKSASDSGGDASRSKEGVPPTPKPVESAGEPLARAMITVDVPADAKLFIAGDLMATEPGTRAFRTPTLAENQPYYYDLRLEVNRDGKTTTDTKRVVVKAGEKVRVNFRENIMGKQP